ncbi:GerAB/ArcD/ProY family transporter [Pseudalkalibacillus sp. SCS-8]|uniref:GerAB/ArcD/ProY family transporter n=1 Tax=Pseudalkalibacillus nanhaiensis TaxID=3115291 RepID=UPI0032D9CEC3
MNKISLQQSVPDHLKVPPQMAFFLVHTMIIGIGVLGFERYIVKDAGYDSWISILLGGVWVHFLVWIIYQLLKNGGGDIVAIHQSLFGGIIGRFLSFLVSLYFLVLCITVLRTFTELIQLWMFPQLNVWVFSALFVLLASYFVTGGLRTVTGICFFSVVLGIPLILLKFYPLQYSHVQNVFPVVDASIMDLLKAAKTMSLSYIGFELLIIYYPFIKRPAESIKWAQFGIMFAIFIYLGTAITSFIYYSEGQLKQVIWSTITLWKIVEFPFISRFEYIGIAIYVFVIIPNICVSLWSATRTFKRTFHIRQTYVLWGYMLIIVITCGVVQDRTQIDFLNSILGEVGFYFTSAYLPFLLVIQTIVNKVRGKS